MFASGAETPLPSPSVSRCCYADPISLSRNASNAGSPSAGSCASSARRAARRPPTARNPASPYSWTKSASAPSRRTRTRCSRDVQRRAVRGQRVGERVDPGHRRDRGHGEHRRGAGAERAQRDAQVLLGAPRGGAEVGLGDHQHVRHLHDPGLQELEGVAGPGLDDHGDGVRGLGHVGLGLADADGLDDDDVERVGQRLRGGAGRGGEAAEALARGHRADEHVAVGGVVLDPGAIAEQRAAAALGGRVDREHRHRLPARAPLPQQAR